MNAAVISVIPGGGERGLEAGSGRQIAGAERSVVRDDVVGDTSGAVDSTPTVVVEPLHHATTG
jgi:hypothetical protein